MGLAAVFAGLFVLMAVLGFVSHLVFLLVAIPFGIVSYTLWYHASGRLRERASRQARAGRSRARGPNEAAAGGFDAGPRQEWTGPRRGADGAGRTRADGARGFGASTRNSRQGRARSASGPELSSAEAYDVLDIDPSADPDRVRRAYRERVKDVHPDTEDGDEASFKRVQQAYERLRNGHEH